MRHPQPSKAAKLNHSEPKLALWTAFPWPKLRSPFPFLACLQELIELMLECGCIGQICHSSGLAPGMNVAPARSWVLALVLALTASTLLVDVCCPPLVNSVPQNLTESYKNIHLADFSRTLSTSCKLLRYSCSEPPVMRMSSVCNVFPGAWYPWPAETMLVLRQYQRVDWYSL